MFLAAKPLIRDALLEVATLSKLSNSYARRAALARGRAITAISDPLNFFFFFFFVSRLFREKSAIVSQTSQPILSEKNFFLNEGSHFEEVQAS